MVCLTLLSVALDRLVVQKDKILRPLSLMDTMAQMILSNLGALYSNLKRPGQSWMSAKNERLTIT